MCRLLLLSNPDGVDPEAHLHAFKKICETSQEYQGHGWGCAWLDGRGQWCFHHHIQPIWEDHSQFPKTPLFLVHARSAFRDEGIVVENNMPFTDGEHVFLFNGELRGVKIKADGRIGAEKIFNYIRRFNKGDMTEATRRGVEIIGKRTRYIRAMNFFLANANRVEICSWFGEDPDYFQLQTQEDKGTRIICSQSYDFDTGHNSPWHAIDNHQLCSLDLATSAWSSYPISIDSGNQTL